MSDEPGCRTPGTVWGGRRLHAAELRLRHRAGGDGCATLAVERLADGADLGDLSFRLDGAGTAEIGCVMRPGACGQGFATQALRRLARHLVADLQCSVLRALPGDAAWARVLDKAGFTGGVLSAAAWQARHDARPMLLVAAAALVDPDGRVLMCRRPPGRAMAGLWEFPGGKLDAGETPERALVRELAEELGVDTGESCLAPVAFASHDYDTFHLLMPLYAIRTWKGMPQPHEGQELKWVRPLQMATLPMPPADVPLVALLREWV